MICGSWRHAVSLAMDDAPTGQHGKYDSYMFVRGLLREGALKCAASPRLAAQLRAVTTTPLPGGGVRITSPPRAGAGHGDVVSALVLGCWAVATGTGADYAALMKKHPHGF